jgi:uncharacterized damage-inducible protein DinB
MKAIVKPQTGTYPEYMGNYIKLVKGENIFEELYGEHIETMELLTSVDEETLQYRYAEGKWNIREIAQHLIDCERIFAYRALRFSRNDSTELAGFDENNFVANSNASKRDINDLVREMSVVRASTVELFKSFTDEMLDKKGTANGKEITVRALLFAIAGHEIHHRNIIEERYLPK